MGYGRILVNVRHPPSHSQYNCNHGLDPSFHSSPYTSDSIYGTSKHFRGYFIKWACNLAKGKPSVANEISYMALLVAYVENWIH
jgi:hypothetical protein